MDFATRLDALGEAEAKSPAAKLREALELYDEGVALQRLAFARRFPDLDEQSLDRMLESWLRRDDEGM